MADRIKGITIEFKGDASNLKDSIRGVNSDIAKTNKELSSVDKALKFNPTSVDLWRQKQELLTQKVSDTQTKLSLLKEQQAQMDASGIEKNSSEYRALERQIVQTESQLKTFSAQLREVGNANLKALSEQFKQAGTSLESVGNSLKGVSLAAAGVVTGLGTISVKAGVAADDLNTLSKVTGIGTQDLQKYSYAADLVDVSTEAIAKSNKKLAKNAYEAANGSKSQAEAFSAIGVSVTDANGELRDSEAIFQDVITSLGSMTNETERDAIAQKLMGKSAAELNPLIEDGGETYKRVADTMQKYGLDYVDQETLDKANEFNDQLDTMKLLGSVAFAQVGSQLAGYLAPALEKVVDLVGKFAKWLSDLSPETLTVIATIASLVAVLAPLLIGLGKVAFAISSIINVVQMASGVLGTLGTGISALTSGPLLLIVGAIAAVIAIGVLLYKNWDKVKATAQAVGTAIINAWNGVKNALANTLNAIKTAFSTVWNGIKTTVTSIVDGIKSKVTGVWDSIKTATSNAWSAIKDRITAPIKAAKDTIDNIIDKIKGWFPIKIGDFFGKIKLPHLYIDGEFSLDPLSVPSIGVDWYDKGGIFDKPSIIGVGEKRPEFVGALDDLRKIVREESGPGNGAAPVINIYPTPYQSAREIAAEVEKILSNKQIRRNMAYGNI